MEYITAQDLYQRIEEAQQRKRRAWRTTSCTIPSYFVVTRVFAIRDMPSATLVRRWTISAAIVTWQHKTCSPSSECAVIAIATSPSHQRTWATTAVHWRCLSPPYSKLLSQPRWSGAFPLREEQPRGSPISSYTYLRCVVRSFDDETIHATVVNQDCDEEVVTINYRHTPDYIDFSYLTRILQDGMTLNLLDCHREDERLIPASSSSSPTICWTSPPSPPASRTTATTLCSSRSTG